MAELLAAPESAPPMPSPGVCTLCGEPVMPVWLGKLSTRLGWHRPTRCKACAEQEHRASEEQRREQERLARLQERARRAALTPERRGKSFDTWRPRPGLETPLQEAREYAACWQSEPRPTRGLLFVGTNGAGKSHLALAVLNEVLTTTTATGLFVEVADYLAALRASFAGLPGHDADDLRRMMREVDLLVLDDIGAANIPSGERGDWIREELTRLLNHREAHGRPVLMTADVGRDDLTARLGKRIVSRIFGACQVVPFPEVPDYRMYGSEG